MRAVNHMFEQYKEKLLQCIAVRLFIINGHMYTVQKDLFGVTKSTVDKAINSLVDEKKVVVEIKSGFLVVTLSVASGKVS